MIVNDLGPTVNVAWDAEDIVLEARCFAYRWNGWACPAFDRANVEKLIKWNNDHVTTLAEWIAWDGDTVRITDLDELKNEDYEEERIYPFLDDEGVQRWAVGAQAWTWYELKD